MPRPSTTRRKINVAWHAAHPMPPRATLERRIEWHVAHAKACGCRDIPGTIRADIKKRRIRP